MHLPASQQAAILFLLKQIFGKYPTTRSQMLEIEDDTVGGGFNVTPDKALYRPDFHDPQLANASETNCIFELLHTYNNWNVII